MELMTLAARARSALHKDAAKGARDWRARIGEAFRVWYESQPGFERDVAYDRLVEECLPMLAMIAEKRALPRVGYGYEEAFVEALEAFPESVRRFDPDKSPAGYAGAYAWLSTGCDSVAWTLRGCWLSRQGRPPGVTIASLDYGGDADRWDELGVADDVRMEWAPPDRDVAADISEVLGTLRPDIRDIVLMYASGYTMTKIAEVIGEPRGRPWVSNQLKIARRAIVSRLGRRGYDVRDIVGDEVVDSLGTR